jgi:hypothetical protein
MIETIVRRSLSAVFILLFLAQGGHVTQTFYEDVPLKDLVRNANVIVVVNKRDPFVAHESIPILPPPGREIKREIPPFTKTTYHFTVVDVLKTNEPIPKGLPLNVSPANEEDNLHIHKLYYIDNIGKSPIYDRYSPSRGFSFEKADTMILFLHTGDHRSFRFAADDAHEAPSQRKIIENLIKENQSGAR